MDSRGHCSHSTAPEEPLPPPWFPGLLPWTSPPPPSTLTPLLSQSIAAPAVLRYPWGLLPLFWPVPPLAPDRTPHPCPPLAPGPLARSSLAPAALRPLWGSSPLLWCGQVGRDPSRVCRPPEPHPGPSSTTPSPQPPTRPDTHPPPPGPDRPYGRTPTPPHTLPPDPR